MGTSNWQNISYSVELIRRLRPRRVLDVGVGFGRWGILSREFLDVWEGHVRRDDWRIVIDGVEAYEPNIEPYHASFYDRIVIADASEYLATVRERYDLIIIGDMLEHLEKPAGEALLTNALKQADFVLLHVPLGGNWEQGEKYGNEFERHRSVWRARELRRWNPIASRHFRDYLYRPFGVFLLAPPGAQMPPSTGPGDRARLELDKRPRLKLWLKRLLAGLGIRP